MARQCNSASANRLRISSKSRFGFLLKAVNDVDEALEPGRRDAAVSIPAVVRNDLNRVQALHGTCRRVALAKFRLIDRLADLKTDGARKLAKPFPGVAHPSDRLSFQSTPAYIGIDIIGGSRSLVARPLARTTPHFWSNKSAR
jgi:hypothetical protein